MIKKNRNKRAKLQSTFQGNVSYPVYNWFNFTEAYSRDLVKEIVEENKVKTRAPVLYDPFCGTGTSLLFAKEKGFECYGTDVSYLMYLISKAKTTNYKKEKLEKLLEKVLEIDEKENITIPKENEWIKKFFYSDSLQTLLKLKNNIEKIKDKEKFFFYIILIKTIEIVSKAIKVGSALKQRKIARIDTLKKFKNIFNELLKDYEKFIEKNNLKVEPEILNESCLTFYKTHDKLFDYIICSPPYLNKTEYTKRFGLELAILGKETILQKHLGQINSLKIKEDKWIYKKYFEKELEEINKEDYKHENYSADEYFQQLELFVKQSALHLKKNAIIAIVIAGGTIKETIFEIYNYMQELYTQNKIEIVNIKVNREITCNLKRTQNIGKIKEFTIIGKKE